MEQLKAEENFCNYRPSILEYDNNSILNNDIINTSNDSNFHVIVIYIVSL